MNSLKSCTNTSFYLDSLLIDTIDIEYQYETLIRSGAFIHNYFYSITFLKGLAYILAKCPHWLHDPSYPELDETKECEKVIHILESFRKTGVKI
jgi:hypothetical protein